MENTQVIDYIKQSFEFKKAKNYKPAIEMLYKILEIENDNIEILYQIGELYFLMNNYDRALQYLDKVLQLKSNHIDALKLYRTIRYREENFEEALNLSKTLFSMNPSQSELNEIIKSLINLNRFEEINQYESSEYFDDDIKIEYANALYKKGEKEKVNQILQKCTSLNENILLLKGKIEFDNKNYEEAKNIFAQIGKQTQNSEILNYIGLFELESMNFIEAIKDFSKAIALTPSNSKYYYNLGNAYFYNGWIKEAKNAYQKALNIAPNNLDYRYSLAYLYYDQKDYNKSQKEVDAILGNNKNHKQALVLKALLLAVNKEYIQAKEILENNLNNNDDLTLSALCEVYTELNIYHKAEEIAKQLIKNSPDNLNYLNNLAKIYIKEKKNDEAIKLVNQILASNPNYISANLLGAEASFAMENYEATKDYAKESLSLDINCSQGYYFLALVREKENDTEEAIECLKRAILYDLNNDIYYSKMSKLYEEQENYKTALEYISEAVAIKSLPEYKKRYSDLLQKTRLNCK